MTPLAALWRTVDAGLGWTMRAVCLGCLTGLFGVLLGMVLIRFLPVATLSWSSEIIELLFAWLVFIGAAALWRDNDHFRIEAILNHLDLTRFGRPLRIVVELIAFGFVLMFTYYTWVLLQRAGGTSPILDWPRELWYVCMPIAGLIMAIYSLRNLFVLFDGNKGGRRPTGGSDAIPHAGNPGTPNTDGVSDGPRSTMRAP